ncbi:MAG: DNA repair protein RecO [Planctomycetales bacterium]|nr:DNA repair protein RecO [Planctomycetales bacterium]
MSLEKSDAIVLRVYPWSETSSIATLFTRDFGKISVLAKGARRPKSPFEAALDLLSICRVVFINKNSDALDLLTEAKLNKRFRAGSRSLLRLYSGYYVAELLDRLTDKGDRCPEMYDLAAITLQELEENLPVHSLVLRLELQILRLIGNLPTWDFCAQCAVPMGTEPRQVFSVAAGGLLCTNCQKGARLMMQISGQTLETLRKYSSIAWRQQVLQEIPMEQRGSIRGLITKYLTYFLDRNLLLHAYLEELGR